ncbi:MAG: SH3 domain-containing protein [Candidatus Protochlamydia sp.]|nr:SH3 domain-containing protein [Candidatus Protochlamydia sp.]
MRKTLLPLAALISFSIPGFLTSSPDENNSTPSFMSMRKKVEKVPADLSAFEPFTGRITKNKVRLRLQPTYEGHVWKEYAKNDLILILGETDDFYAARPPEDAKGYVFRTYILDNVVEGSRVNVRLKPNLESPIIAQLNSGDRIEGTIDPANSKWLEIKLPPTARFYIAKEYIERVGDSNHLAKMEKRKQEVSSLLGQTEASSLLEMQKPFNQVNVEGIKANYEYIIANYADFPEAGEKAKVLLNNLQQAYVAKKMSFLESQANYSSRLLEAKNKQLADELKSQKSKLVTLEEQLEKEHQEKQTSIAELTPKPTKKPTQLPINMAVWLPIEEGLFAHWSETTGKSNPNVFYDEQKQHSFVLKGVVDPYNRPVKNKPGDYMLINAASKLPIAFLYSTQINLQDYIGHEVTVRVSPRPNNHYAFPAYFVLSFE